MFHSKFIIYNVFNTFLISSRAGIIYSAKHTRPYPFLCTKN